MLILPDPLKYVIFTTPRTRSNLLCLLLRKSGVAGNPSEWNTSVKNFSEFYKDDVVGVKVQKATQSGFLKYVNYFDKFIYLQHPDPIWQAISDLRALKIKKFADYRKHPNQKRCPLNERIWQIPISHQDIIGKIRLNIIYDREYLDFFEESGISPLTIWYHELGTPDQQYHTLKRIMDFLGINKPFRFEADFSEDMFVQSDAWNEKVYEDFLKNFM